MKKFLYPSSIALIIAATSIIAACSTSTPNHDFPPVNPQCKPIMEHMRASHNQIEQLIQENKPTEIGNIIITDHELIKQNPQCKPLHPMPPMPALACGPSPSEFPPMNPECKSVMKHMHASHKQIEHLIQKDQATKIGKIIIADDRFIEQYPECKPPHPMPPIPDVK